MAFLEYHPTQILYQFSSVEGFRGIVASRAIWCTDLASGNDPREIALGYQHFTDAMNYVRENEYKGKLGRFLDVLSGHISQYRKQQQTFCACFSTVKDSLPMWREYGSNYEGVSIGFRPTAIIPMPGRIQKVKYLHPETPEEFRRLVRDIASNFETDHDPNDFRYWLDAGVSVFAAMTALKHHSWSYEDEVRFIHAQVREDPGHRQIAEYADEMPVYWEKPLTRSRAGLAIEYKQFSFGRRRNGISDPTKAIAELILGPRCKLTEADAFKLLQSEGYTGFEIRKSECQIR